MENAEFEEETNNLNDSDNHDEIESGKKIAVVQSTILNFFIANNPSKFVQM